MSTATIYRGEENIVECAFGSAETGKSSSIRCEVQYPASHNIVETLSGFIEKQVKQEGVLTTILGTYQAIWTPARNETTYPDNSYRNLVFRIDGEAKYAEETVRIEESRRSKLFV